MLGCLVSGPLPYFQFVIPVTVNQQGLMVAIKLLCCCFCELCRYWGAGDAEHLLSTFLSGLDALFMLGSQNTENQIVTFFKVLWS